jgi:dihydroflavonol-4-reductase
VQVFLTGATGFLGRHLVPLLLERGDELRALVRPKTDARALEAMGVEVLRGELVTDDVRPAAAGCELVFNLAGRVSHEPKDLPLLREANVDGPMNVLKGIEPGARFLHVSSVAAVGPAPAPGRLADETQPFPARATRYPYAATKRAGEKRLLEAEADVVVANPGFLLGPGDVYRVSTWHVERYLRGFMRFHTPGGLSNVDARDVAAGLVALAERGRSGERYILTNREGNLSHEQLFRRLGDVTGVRRRMIGLPPRVAALSATVLPWPVRPGEVRAAANWWFYEPTKAEHELGFTVRPLDETLAATAAQYLSDRRPDTSGR